MADLRLTHIGKSFGATRAVRNLTLEVGSGEFIVLLGPSGAGKTTTLRLVAGLEAPDSGQVAIDGRDVTALSPALRNMATIPSANLKSRHDVVDSWIVELINAIA